MASRHLLKIIDLDQNVWFLSRRVTSAATWFCWEPTNYQIQGAVHSQVQGSKQKKQIYWFERSWKSPELRSRWTPDPTFLEMSPVKSKYPKHDKQAWERGDLSTDAVGTYIGDWSVVLVHFLIFRL